MGGQPSKTVGFSTHEKAVIERLRDARLSDDDYVEVDPNAEKNALERGARNPEELSLSLVESWQTSILKDPKNRSARLMTLCFAHT